MKNLLIIRTFRPVGTGGPVIPLELLYIASAVLERCNTNFNIKIIDMGICALRLVDIENKIKKFRPDIVIMNSLIWEADIAHAIAASVKKYNKHTVVVGQGQLPTLAGELMLNDKNLDYLIIGEPDITSAELMEAIANKKTTRHIKGLIYRNTSSVVKNPPRELIENLDDFNINASVWDLVDVKKYADYANWNGSLKEKFYIPVQSSRGCPFDCTFCCNKKVIGKKFRARSPESVLSEIRFLNKKYGVREIHFFDPVFNYDRERAKKICSLIASSNMNISLAFPHGLRADLMTDDLLERLKEAGTYKLVYGIETGSSRLQKVIKKNLDLKRVLRVIEKTAKKGITVGGYFMLGFPTESIEDMRKTINFAVNSRLDVAAFFKATQFDDIIELYKSGDNEGSPAQQGVYDFEDLAYYSSTRSYAAISAAQLNSMILLAQQKFYLNFKRLKRNFSRAPDKLSFLKNTLKAFGLLLQGYIIRELSS